MAASLGCAISAQEHSSLKPLRASLAPHQRGVAIRRQDSPSLSLTAPSHVLTSSVAPPEFSLLPLTASRPTPAQSFVSSFDTAAAAAARRAKWFDGVQTKFFGLWQALGAQLSQVRLPPPGWPAPSLAAFIPPHHLLGHRRAGNQQQQQQQAAAAAPASAAVAGPKAAAARPGSPRQCVVGAARPLLAPYLTMADDVELSFAAMLADLCNMAYDVTALDADLVEARHHLVVVATSVAIAQPGAADLAGGGGSAAAAKPAPVAAVGGTTSSPVAAAATHTSGHAAALPVAQQAQHQHAPSHRPLSPSVSLLQLTSPEAVTAALTSFSAASTYPVYMSTLHQGLTSLASYDEDGDLDWISNRQALAEAAVASWPATMASMDDISAAVLLHGPPQSAAAAAAAAAGGSVDDCAVGAGGVLFCDASLSEERDFLAGGIYGYNTPLVERRVSEAGEGGGVAGGVASGHAAAHHATGVLAAGSEGGKALRAQQEQPAQRRRSISGTSPDGAVLEHSGAAAPPVVLACAKQTPSAWFCADDKLTKTRYIAIQGSTSLEHWHINLQFEPVVFEDPAFGVRIHRGVYEAAQLLYEDLLPLVQQHLAASPHATISLSGHSLGGSLATVLMLLFVGRGVISPANMAPVYTFGAPAVFCKGATAGAPANRCATCSLPCEMRGSGADAHPHDAAHACGDAGHVCGAGAKPAAHAHPHHHVPGGVPIGLLASLGLTDDHVVNVMMHKDIVPRAFVCDYTSVAGVLQQWWPSFRDHSTLQEDAGPHRALYNFVGRLALLRPSESLPFVHGPADAAHPMLPNLPALYRVGLPDEASASPAGGMLDYAAASLASWDELLDGTAFAAAMQKAQEALHWGCGRREQARLAKMAEMQANVLQFMNHPHPLTILSEYQSYGPDGSISRMHNPSNYAEALVALSDRL